MNRAGAFLGMILMMGSEKSTGPVASDPMDEDGAMAAVLRLPETREFADHCHKESASEVHVRAMCDFPGDPDEIWVRVFEDHQDHIITWEIFAVNRKSGKIDPVNFED